MFVLKGKFNTATIYSDRPDYASFEQVKQMLNCPAFVGADIKIMPDYHAGKGSVVGFTAKGMKHLIPNIIGVDIGCGVLGVPLGHTLPLSLEKIDDIITEIIPSGFSVREKEPFEMHYELLNCYEHLTNIQRIKNSLGTLGGGNHFLEVDEDSQGNFWLVIHTGSRNLGKQVADYWQSIAVKDLEADREKVMRETLKTIPPKEREVFLKNYKKESSVPKGLEYLTGESEQNYIYDMCRCQDFAVMNRHVIAWDILNALGLPKVLNNAIESIHNYYDKPNDTIRKGAISAQKGEQCIIPLNMRDGTLICQGKGNAEWNNSAPHGAGRLYSRSQAKHIISLEEFQDSMEGIYSTSVVDSTIDESPMAYKPAEEIREQIIATVATCNVLTPIYNFKAK